MPFFYYNLKLRWRKQFFGNIIQHFNDSQCLLLDYFLSATDGWELHFQLRINMMTWYCKTMWLLCTLHLISHGKKVHSIVVGWILVRFPSTTPWSI